MRSSSYQVNKREGVQIYEDGRPMEGEWNEFRNVEDAERLLEHPDFSGNRLLHSYSIVEKLTIWHNYVFGL